MIKGIAYLILFFCSLGSLFGQANVDSLYQVVDLHEDLDQLKEKIIEIHPNPFVYCSEDEFNEAFSLSKAAITEPMTYSEFGAVIGRVLRVLHDSHTSINFGNYMNPYREAGSYFLDLAVWTVEDKLIVRSSYYSSLPIGAEIIQINGQNVNPIHARVAAFSVYEGLSITGFNRVNDALFSSFCSTIGDVGRSNKILVHIPGDTVLHRLTLRGYKSEQLKERRKNRADTEPSVFELDINEEDDLAVLKIGSFAQKSSRSYSKFLKKSFKEIQEKGITNLAIDLRYNTGGSSARVEELFTYISAGNDVMIPANIIAKQSKESAKRFEGRFNRFSRKLIRFLAPKNEDLQHFTAIADYEIGHQDTVYFKVPEKSPKYVYQGESFLLINGLSGSASANSAGIFRSMDLGLIIGEPCLGPINGTWGNPIGVSLDNTSMPVLIASIRFNTNNSFIYRPQPVNPDIQVEWTQDHYFTKRDADLEALLRILKD
ncbi:MAG: S41 family peptidase [Flavobacteriales bacterium]|nr:S41 family peptidase [Flavobacteriales bacterium]MDG1780052.1 S41 family peptidase [Flavobacteriales bacterium]MDG2246594.1 S41 family peptidase [Flavobacteriales bacterium]